MSDHIYRITEVVGSSPDSLEAAIGGAINRAADTLHGLEWFQVSEIRGHVEAGAVGHYQVTVKVGFRLDS